MLAVGVHRDAGGGEKAKQRATAVNHFEPGGISDKRMFVFETTGKRGITIS